VVVSGDHHAPQETQSDQSSQGRPSALPRQQAERQVPEARLRQEEVGSRRQRSMEVQTRREEARVWEAQEEGLMAKKWSDEQRSSRPPRFKKWQYVRVGNDNDTSQELGRVIDIEKSTYHGVGEAPLVEYRYKVATERDPNGTLYFGMYLNSMGAKKKTYKRRAKAYASH
jgi:hypothetical protein